MCIFIFAFEPQAHARLLQEPKAFTLNAQNFSATAIKRMDSAEKIGVECTKELLKSKSSIDGVACRVLAFRQAQKKQSLTNKEQLQSRLKAAETARDFALNLLKYQPMVLEPDFAEKRVRTHKQSCNILFDLYDDSQSLQDKKLKASAQTVLNTDRFSLFKEACDCAQNTAQLMLASNLPLEEQAQIQGVITQRGCYLDREKIYSEREGEATQFKGDADRFGKVENLGDDEKISAFVRSQELSLKRCKDMNSSKTKIKDPDKIKNCYCNIIQKWKLPKLESKSSLIHSIEILPKRAALEFEVRPNGSIGVCGKMTGAGVQ
jgi:hypothetical protein